MKLLADLRSRLDTIDANLVSLLSERAEIALSVREAKKQESKSVYAPAREREILERVEKLAAEGAFPAGQMRRIFLNILSATRAIVGDMQVCFSGAELSLCHVAAIKQFGEHASYKSSQNEMEMFDLLDRGDVNFGVFTAESTANGLFAAPFLRLMHSEFQIVAEIRLPDRLALFSNEKAMAAIQRVYATPEYLRRASGWLDAALPQAERIVEADSAAGAARLEAEKDSGTAVLALDAVSESIERSPLALGLEQSSFLNVARCLIVGAEEQKKSG